MLQTNSLSLTVALLLSAGCRPLLPIPTSTAALTHRLANSEFKTTAEGVSPSKESDIRYRFLLPSGYNFTAEDLTGSSSARLKVLDGGEKKFVMTYSGYLMNVIRLGPSIQDEIVIVTSVGASSQSYRLLAVLLTHKPRVVLDETASPIGLSYLPFVKEDSEELELGFKDAHTRDWRCFKWLRRKQQFAEVPKI